MLLVPMRQLLGEAARGGNGVGAVTVSDYQLLTLEEMRAGYAAEH